MIRTPLRYPGGKGKMYNRVKQIIEENNLQEKTYTEPFAGGFGIGIKLIANNIVNRTIINDYDYRIYAIWDCIFHNTENFINLINETPINIEMWKKQKEIYKTYKNFSLLEVGFSAFFLNRTNYSGVLKGGPIGGISQEGKYKVDCRFNKSYLIGLIRAISQFRETVEIYNYDAKEFINKIVKNREKELFINFDPPYVQNGQQLYTNFYKEDDHRALANVIISQCKDVYWIMTYDDNALIKEIYNGFENEELLLTYTAGGTKTGKEILLKHLK